LRGLRLYIRPIEPSDREAVEVFLNSESEPGTDRGAAASNGARGLLGKLLGEIVAVAFVDDGDESALRLRRLLVARSFRKKWIGRAMLRELDRLAQQMNRTKIVVEDADGAQEFFRRTGFQSEGERWVRVVS
jgi:GNAT superfamily N-acetyltransferase